MFYIILTGVTVFGAYQLIQERQSQEQYSMKTKTTALGAGFMPNPNEQKENKENNTLEEKINVEWRREIRDHEEEWMEAIKEENATITEEKRKIATDWNYEKDQVEFSCIN